MKEIPESVYAMTDSMYEEMAGPDVAELLAPMPATGARSDRN